MAALQAHRAFIAQRLAQGLKLSKLRKLLPRYGVQVPYATLHRFAVAELGFGRMAATVTIADCDLAHALGHIACRHGHSVLVLRGDKMRKQLKHARLDKLQRTSAA